MTIADIRAMHERESATNVRFGVLPTRNHQEIATLLAELDRRELVDHQLRAAVGLPDDAQDADVLALVATLTARDGDRLAESISLPTRLREALDLPADASASQIVGRVARLLADYNCLVGSVKVAHRALSAVAYHEGADWPSASVEVERLRAINDALVNDLAREQKRADIPAALRHIVGVVEGVDRELAPETVAGLGSALRALGVGR